MSMQTILIEVEDPNDPTLQEYLKGILEAWYDRKVEIVDYVVTIDVGKDNDTMMFSFKVGGYY